jgi:hypothetical protein
VETTWGLLKLSKDRLHDSNEAVTMAGEQCVSGTMLVAVISKHQHLSSSIKSKFISSSLASPVQCPWSSWGFLTPLTQAPGSLHAAALHRPRRSRRRTCPLPKRPGQQSHIPFLLCIDLVRTCYLVTPESGGTATLLLTRRGKMHLSQS